MAVHMVVTLDGTSSGLTQHEILLIYSSVQGGWKQEVVNYYSWMHRNTTDYEVVNMSNVIIAYTHLYIDNQVPVLCYCKSAWWLLRWRRKTVELHILPMVKAESFVCTIYSTSSWLQLCFQNLERKFLLSLNTICAGLTGPMPPLSAFLIKY